MAHECYHCKQWIADGEAHDCWTTTEAALTRDLSEDLQEAWERLRETAAAFGDQKIYASHHSIMFSRKSCYFFVRPKKSYLEVCLFLERIVHAPQVRRRVASSKTKRAHLLRIRHRDEVEPPITEWLKEAYGLADPARRTTVKASKRPPNTAVRARQAARTGTPARRGTATPRRKTRTRSRARVRSK